MVKPTKGKILQAALASLQHPGQSTTPLPKLKNKKPPILYIFRHCQSYDNIRHIFSGQRNSHLTPEGKKQAKKLAVKLKEEPINLFISPPLARCLETLQEVKKYHPQAKILTFPQLSERDYGSLTGKSKLRMMKLYPQKTLLWRRSWQVAPPNGESLEMVWNNRIRPFLINWLIPYARKEKINIGWVATNNTMRLVRMFFEHLSIEEMLQLENPYGDWAEYSLTEIK